MELLSKTKDADGRIQIPGIYDDVKEPARRGIGKLDDAAVRREEFLTNEVGSTQLTGEPDRSVLERVWSRPTLEVHGIAGGFTGAGAKTVIPAKATAKVSFRLVPEPGSRQSRRGLQEVRCRQHARGDQDRGSRAEPQPGRDGQSRSSGDQYGRPARSRTCSAGRRCSSARGGSIPIVGDFARICGIPTILMGFGLPDDGLHSPNEKYKIANYYTGIMTVAHFLEQYGQWLRIRLQTQSHGERSQSESVVRSAGIVSVAVFMSRVTGLVREVVMAATVRRGRRL